MADNKQYITQEQDQGAVLISEDVIATIVENAVAEVDGIVGLNTKTGSDIAEMIGKKAWGKGMKITIDEDNNLTIDCNVNIGYGINVVTVAQSVQDSVVAAVESTANVKVSAVNVNVSGIIRQ